MDKSTDFPQYRRLSNKKAFYKILDDRNFIELQRMGKKVLRYEVRAEQYPEILRIMDMLKAVEPFERSDEEEFNSYEEN